MKNQIDPAVFDAAVTSVVDWLRLYVDFFEQNPGEANAREIIGHTRVVRDSSANPKTERRSKRQRYLVFVGERDGEVVAAGIIQLSGKNIAIHMVGVLTSAQSKGIGKDMFRWFLGGLPARHRKAKARLGVYRTNKKMLKFMLWLEARDKTGKPWDIAGDRGDIAVFLDLRVARACEVLGVPQPSGRDYHFSTDPVGSVRFRARWFGHPPERVTPRERVIVDTR